LWIGFGRVSSFRGDVVRQTPEGKNMGMDKDKKKQDNGKKTQAESPSKPAKRKIDDDDLDDIFSKPKKQEKKPEGLARKNCTCTIIFADHVVKWDPCDWFQSRAANIWFLRYLHAYMLN
jgi:hypothetical protein